MFDGKTIDQVSSTKFLGLLISKNSSWSKQIEEIYKNVASTHISASLYSE